MSFQDGARRVATRPIAAGPGGESMLFGLGAPWTLSMVYALIGVPSVIAGLLAALAIGKNGWISAPHWRALTGILAQAWITLLSMYVKFQPASLLLTVIVYVIAAAIFASWALRLMIIKLRWMRQPARDIFRVIH